MDLFIPMRHSLHLLLRHCCFAEFLSFRLPSRRVISLQRLIVTPGSRKHA